MSSSFSSSSSSSFLYPQQQQLEAQLGNLVVLLGRRLLELVVSLSMELLEVLLKGHAREEGNSNYGRFFLQNFLYLS